MLRESLLMVPVNDNDGRSLASLRDSVANELAETFGGVTMRESQGAWVDPSGKLIREPLTELISACEPCAASDSVLRRLAAKINREGNQYATYVRFPDSHVEIIENQDKAANDNQLAA